MKWTAFVAATPSLIQIAVGQDVLPNEDLVLAPPRSKLRDEGLQDGLLIMFPGGGVSPGYYEETLKGIQKAADMRLWAIVPAFDDKLCIRSCPTPERCDIETQMDRALEKARSEARLRKSRGNFDENVFVLGHSLGAACAANYAEQSANTFNGVVSFDGPLISEEFSTPLIHVRGVLSGGLARLSSTHPIMKVSEKVDDAIKNRPIVMLDGISHSDFCPGFTKPGTITVPLGSRPDEPAASLIGEAAAAFINIHATRKLEPITTSRARRYLGRKMMESREMMDAFDSALEYEGEDNGEARWCGMAQRQIADLGNYDTSRVRTMMGTYSTTVNEFLQSRVSSNLVATSRPGSRGVAGTALEVRVQGFKNGFSSSDTNGCGPGAKEIICKLQSGSMLADQLGVSNVGKDISCAQLNEDAMEKAKAILQETEFGRKALKRYEAGRQVVFAEDDYTGASTSTIAAFLSRPASFQDSLAGRFLSIGATRNGPVPITGGEADGTQYCRLISPARLMDFILTDSLASETKCNFTPIRGSGIPIDAPDIFGP